MNDTDFYDYAYLLPSGRHDNSFLTNFCFCDEKYYRAAIAEYERVTGVKNRYYIKDSAFDVYNNPINALSLHVRYRGDSSHFWRIYKEIKNNMIMFKKPKTFNQWINKNSTPNIWD